MKQSEMPPRETKIDANDFIVQLFTTRSAKPKGLRVSVYYHSNKETIYAGSFDKAGWHPAKQDGAK